jgi:small ubiquitin-related modifier
MYFITQKSLESMKFMFDGAPVKPELTPEDLEMEDEDKIGVVASQVGGAEEDDKKIEHVNIKVVGSNGNEVCKSIPPYKITEAFKIKKTATLAKLMSAYVNKMGVERSAVRFQFDGAELQGHETPESLNLEDDDTIEVLNTQIGGFTSSL